MPDPPADPQYLRFTRSGQAVHFIILGLIFTCAAGALAALGTKWINIDDYAPPLPHPWWSFPAIIPALACFWVAAFNTRHAYLVFGPVGIEIYPFLFPAKNMNLIPWAQIQSLDLDDQITWLTISNTPDSGGGGSVLSLRPITPNNRKLLAHAIDGIRKNHLPSTSE
ncbi:MAG: hypothetical protein AAF591_15130 [Verrucomicrobiota bacterium]